MKCTLKEVIIEYCDLDRTKSAFDQSIGNSFAVLLIADLVLFFSPGKGGTEFGCEKAEVDLVLGQADGARK